VKVGFGASAEKYVLVLAGDDGATLQQHAAVVEKELRSIPGIGAVTSSPASCGPSSSCGPTAPAPPTWA
jgi:hypothetical protein